nr:hypothetical protein [Tanacetum cinerariifolium]
MNHQYPTVAKIPVLDTGKFEEWQFWIQQYLQHEHYALWERKKNDVKARTTLLLSLPDEHQLRFSKSDLDTMSLDDLYNHLKVYESEVQKKPEPNSQNMALISSAKHSSRNEDDDMEEMDIKWNMALLSMRADKAPRSQDRGRRDNFRQGSKAKEQALKALIAIDRVGWVWSYMANDEEDHALVADEVAPTEFALMANTSAESKVFDNSLCSKDCKKNNDNLNNKITYLTDKLFDANNFIYHYKLALAQVESRLVEPSPTAKSISEDDQNRNTSVSETVASPITSKPFIKFVRPKDSQSDSKTDKKETPKKSPVKPVHRTLAVRSPSRAPWVPTVNRNYSPVNRKFSTGSRNFPTANRKFPTASTKFPTGSTKSITADMGLKGKAGSSQNKIDDKGYWDSGSSMHMIGNISYLSDFEPYNGGYVSFGQGGCKIIGKGTIKTECIVLGRDFKLLDNANILLRTPRQHNMYSIDLNNIVPHKDLTCLVAKASVDECMLWNKRLGKQHKASCKSKLVNSVSKPLHTLHMDLYGPTSDETSGILKKFITEIENLKDLNVKII